MNRLNFSFVVIMIVLIGLFGLFLLYPPSIPILASQKSVVFHEGGDWLADFFNVLRYISDESGYYFSKINEADGHSGFPLSIAILYPFTLLVDYTGMSLQDCWVSKGAVFSCIMFLVVLLFFFWDSLRRLCDKYGVKKYNLVIFLFSSVFIFSVERANSIFITAALINYFLVYYDSEIKGQRYFSLLCICLSAVLKGYPVFFGLLLLKEKRFKDIGLCIIISLLLAFVPFLFMDGGFDNLAKMIENTGYNNDSYLHNSAYMFGMHKLVYLVCRSVNLNPLSIDTIISATRVIEVVLVLFTVLLVVVEDRKWKQILLIACAVILFPSNSGFYCGLYLFPAILIFFSDRKAEVLDYFIMILLCLVINPFQIVLPYMGKCFYLTSLMSNFCVGILWILLIITSLSKLKGFKLKQLI